MSDESASSDDRYRLLGLPITPAGIQDLIIELFEGQTAERHVIVKAVETTHLERGGAVSRAADFPGSVKKALSQLKDSGIADSPAYGFWRIKRGEGSQTVPEVIQPDTFEDETPLHAELTIGEGESFVYLYYYPTYRRHAQDKGSHSWQCKIGRSDRDPISRVYSQASTALPESPKIGLLLRTSLPSQWERVLHGILALRGQIVEDAPGEEWFYTSPEEIVKLVQYIDPTLKSVDT